MTAVDKETVYKEYGQSHCQSMVKRLCIKSMGNMLSINGKETVYKEYGQSDNQINGKETMYKEYVKSDNQSMVKRLCIKSLGKVTINQW